MGTQYRSAIFPMDEEQERVARASLACGGSRLWDDLSSIEPLTPFMSLRTTTRITLPTIPIKGTAWRCRPQGQEVQGAVRRQIEVRPLIGFSPSHVKAPDWINPERLVVVSKGKTVQHEKIPLFLPCLMGLVLLASCSKERDDDGQASIAQIDEVTRSVDAGVETLADAIVFRSDSDEVTLQMCRGADSGPDVYPRLVALDFGEDAPTHGAGPGLE